jgi:hypothetical protein
MKPKDAFGRYGCVPRDLHPAWFEVSWSARAIGMALFSLIDDFETRRIDIHGDWMDSLCKRLAIGGKERRFAKPALRSLVEVRLLTVHRTFIVVNTTPADSDGTSKSTQVPENNQVSFNSKQAAIKASERERARESSARFEKPPIPPAPPELPAAEQEREPWLRVWELYAEHIGLDVFQLAGAGTQERALRAIAASSEVEAGGSQGVAFENAVKRLLRAWSADKWVQEKRPSIANLALNLHRYAAPKQKPIVKLAPQPADSLMEHWSRIDAMRREEQRREDELNEIRCREALAEYEALDRAGGES